MASELIGAAAAAAAFWAFAGPFRGFAALAAAKLLLRRGRRAAPAALALVALPSLFGCLLLADATAAALRLAAASRRRPGGLLGRIASAAALVSDVDAALAALPARALRPPSSASSPWAFSPSPAGNCIGCGRCMRAVSVARRWLLVAAAAAAFSPFSPAASAAGSLLPRFAMVAWLLSSVPRPRPKPTGAGTQGAHAFAPATL